jgi:presenilin-like A22 family membrane protease
LEAKPVLGTRAFFILLAIFTSAQLLAIFAGGQAIADMRDGTASGFAEFSDFAQVQSGGLEQALFAMVYVLIGAAVMVIFVKKYKGDMFFILMELAVVTFCSGIVFYAFLRLAGIVFAQAVAAGLCVGFALALAKFRFPQMRNVSAALSSAGAGAAIGAAMPMPAVFAFMILLSVYDYIAVFSTKHMVEIATAVSKRNMPFSISSKEKTAKGDIALELGTGDISMPAALAVSALAFGWQYSALAVVSGMIAVFVIFYIVSRRKGFIPAMPVIAVFNIGLVGIPWLVSMLLRQ